MDQRPVGLLDSGLGGISVLGEALRQLPNEDYVYYGDTANAPYGDKTPEEVLGLVHQAVERLIELRCKAIVIACNTATSVSAGKLRQELALPIIGMEPALKPASLLPGEGKILVMATRVTLALPKFQALMAQYGRDAVPVPCPGLMECVERGELEGPQVTALLRQLLGPWLSQPVKAVVLGCTTTADRFNGARAMLDHAFASYVAYTPPVDTLSLQPIPVRGGREPQVALTVETPEPLLLKKGTEKAVESTVELAEDLEAPVEKGQIVGTWRLTAAEETLGEYPVCAAEAVAEMDLRTAYALLYAALLR